MKKGALKRAVPSRAPLQQLIRPGILPDFRVTSPTFRCRAALAEAKKPQESAPRGAAEHDRQATFTCVEMNRRAPSHSFTWRQENPASAADQDDNDTTATTAHPSPAPSGPAPARHSAPHSRISIHIDHFDLRRLRTQRGAQGVTQVITQVTITTRIDDELQFCGLGRLTFTRGCRGRMGHVTEGRSIPGDGWKKAATPGNRSLEHQCPQALLSGADFLSCRRSGAAARIARSRHGVPVPRRASWHPAWRPTARIASHP